jgi:hypothetical protein
MIRASIRIGLLASFVAAAGSCSSRSEEDIRADFKAYVAAHDQCATVTDCVLVFPDCPLGCYAAVNVGAKDAAEAKAAALVAEYRQDHGTCVYECSAAIADCVANHCVIVTQ